MKNEMKQMAVMAAPGVDDFSEFLAVRGVRVMGKRLVFDRDLNEREMALLAGKIRWVYGRAKFLLGDLVCKVTEQRARLQRPRNKEHAEQLELEALGNFADMMDLPRDEVVNMQRTMAFFPHAGRDYALSFEHYREAFANAGGDALRANGWMELAEAQQWNVAKFRAFIRKELSVAGAADVDAEEMPDDGPGYDIKHDEVALWATKRTREVPRMSPAQRQAILTALRPVENYISALKNPA